MAHNENGLLQVPKGVVIQKFSNPERPDDTSNFHHRTYQKLFAHPPCPADLVQGTMGDCYLVSALNSIVSCPGGPEAIEGCFLDRSSGGASGEIIMRLFDTNCAPQYFSMSKTVVTGVGARHTIWAKLFEKGYASLFLGGSYSSLETSAGKANGMGSDVLRAVLGVKSNTLPCYINDSTFERLIAPGTPSNKRMVQNDVFGGDQNLVDQWWSWMRPKFQAWRDVVGTSTCYRLEDWDEFLSGPGADMPDNLRDAVVAWMKDAAPLPGRRGTGNYTPTQRTLYSDIQSALAANKPVSTGTHASVAPNSKILGKGSAGEGKAASGLVGGHAYSILDAKSEDGLLWVKLQNPWKEWGVRYEKGVYNTGPKSGRPYLKPRYDPNIGDFWLEMCDLTKHFKGIYIGEKQLAS